MPLHEFKTQVLLLHSEQDTLDKLSSGFSESYTVHCATSGSEALNTLGETQIDVIVSTQELPGMSGLEALREAKKRSPETIGILLAGSADAGLEALVTDKEVFRVVRGNVSDAAILELVDEATQQMRLMTLEKSANDTTANVDESAPEHIVMETSDNGASIVSDGSARLPALDPATFSTISAVGSQAVDLLVLTKDQEFLATIKESSKGMHTVHYANTLAQAVETISSQSVGVAVVDAAMVGEKVEQLAQHLRKISPRLVSIVAGRRDDGEMLMDLINRGNVYRFLLKPVSPGRARLAVEASVKHHLEAPDAAFKTKGGAAAASPDATPAAPPAINIEKQQKAPPQAPSAAETERHTAPQSSDSTEPAAGTSSVATQESPMDDELTDVFGDRDTGFAATVTGLFNTVGKKFSDDGDVEAPGVQAAASESDSTRAAAGSGGSLLQGRRMLGIVGVAVIAIAGAIFWLTSGPDESATNDEPIAARSSVQESEPVIEAAGVDTATENDTAASEQQALVVEALSQVEAALLESRIDDADAALQRIESEDPGNTRLPFLKAQLSQIQLREHLTDARSAILESRFEDASESLESARSLDVADTTELDAVANELSVAQSQQQSEEILALAHSRLEEGKLLSPANDNARHYYDLVLENDPENTAARQGLSVVASKLALQARTEIDNNFLDSAQELLGAADALDPSNSELAAAVAALSSKRDAIAAQRRAAEERLAAEAAELQAAEQRAAEEAAAQPAPEQATEEAPAVAADVTKPGDAQASSPNEDSNTAMADSAAALNPATDDEPAEEKLNRQQAEVVEPSNPAPDTTLAAVSTLIRTKYVAPRYPRAAQRRNISGWVDVAFTVTTDGTVKDIDVRNSEPGDTFVNAATNAVAKWEFEPVLVNGMAAEKRAGIRMMFALE